MKNFVIINGVNSNTINGLGINELPPISKPSMRVLTEEIDGRDGDITTNLGYSAYDKTITIGLFGTGYDINDIISFFNGEGTIVFSNEDDKYYKYKIINQIDYEALQKFKQATITFHCQPFKYPLTETPLEIEYDYIEQTGETLTLNNTGESILDLSLKGNTSQTGTPTPDTPIPINVVSGDNEVVVCGKNLFDGEYKHLALWSTTQGANTTFAGNNNDYVSAYCRVESGKTYSISRLKETNRFAVSFSVNEPVVDGATKVYNTGSGKKIENITIPSGYNYLFVYLSNSGENTDDLGLMINEGTTEQPYEPYQSQTYPINLGELELCKIGDYQDYFYKDSGKWYLHKEIGEKIFTGNDNWQENSTYNCYSLNLGEIINKQTQNSLSNLFIERPIAELSINSGMYTKWTSILYVGYPNSTLQGLKDKLNINNMILKYPLATPTNTEITDNTLINQLDNIQNAMSYEGQTNVMQVNDDKPFIIDAKALEQGSDEVVVNNIGNATSKPLIALEGTGNINIYLDGTQVLQANVEDKMNIDIDKLEAYNPDTSALLNRQVTGNYNSMTIPSGESIMKIDGALDKATITNYTRWL